MFGPSVIVCLMAAGALPSCITHTGVNSAETDTLEQYPTTLTSGDHEPTQARACQSSALVSESGAATGSTESFTRELAARSFDQLWDAYDKQYAMFVLRPEVDWNELRAKYRPAALDSTSAHEFATVCAEMLRHLRDLHIWVKIGDEQVPVFDRPCERNANPTAYRSIIGQLNQAGRSVQWGKTSDNVGFIVIYAWNDDGIPDQFDAVLEEMRDTRGLILDVRPNGGGREPLARRVAGRFVETKVLYAYSQYRNGPKHTDLTGKIARYAYPRKLRRYDRPVLLLIGQKCSSSNESFISMMAECSNVTTMGDRTCGSSGNPRMLNLPAGVTVSIPRWIDCLPDGTPLDERGVLPDIPFEAEPGAFEGERDDLLVDAIERLRSVSLPGQPAAGSNGKMNCGFCRHGPTGTCSSGRVLHICRDPGWERRPVCATRYRAQRVHLLKTFA